MLTSTFNGAPADVHRIVAELPAMLAGRVPDVGGLAEGIKLRVGMVLLGLIQQAFIIKARGGTDDCGIKWAELKPETIARRRLGPSDKKAITLKARAPTLSEAQRRNMEKAVRTKAADLQVMQGMHPNQAKGLARAMVERAHRAAGTVASKFSILSNRDVEILRDTDELLESFSPGVPGQHEGQVFRMPPGEVIVGTNKKHWHHAGTRTIPARPFWPPDGNLPATWWDALLDTARTGAMEAIQKMLARAH